MRYEWRVSKSIPFGDYTAEFLVLYEDKRDVMCDSPRPEWGVADCEDNRAIHVRRNSGLSNRFGEVDEVRFCVSRDEGNRIYREMVKIDNHGYGRFAADEWVRERSGK